MSGLWPRSAAKHGLVHALDAWRGEGRSVCGIDFLNYQTRWDGRAITCVRCVVGDTKGRAHG